MSNVFRRPMFRGGPTNMNGIMSGIQDRQNYEVGGTARERLMKAFEEYPVQGVDPLSQFLIQGGLNLMSATPRGGVLATAAEAFKEPLARIKAKDKDVYAAQLYETQVEKMRDNLVDAAEARIISKFKGAKADDISRKTTDFIMQAPSSLKSNLIDIDYVDVGKKGVSQYVPDLANVQVGQIFYDATLGQWKKRVGEGQGRLDFVTLDSYSGYKEIEIDQ
jgi:hypothetical protein